MSEHDLSGIWLTGERERNISGEFALAVSDWAERTPTKRNIELSVTLLRSASLTCSAIDLYIVFCPPYRNFTTSLIQVYVFLMMTLVYVQV